MRRPVEDPEQGSQSCRARESTKPDPHSQRALALSQFWEALCSPLAGGHRPPHPCLVCADSESPQESRGLRPQTEGEAGTWPCSSILQRPGVTGLLSLE